MFRKTRIKLAAWYLLIIMLVSVSFSVVIYRVLTTELDRFERAERVRIERRFPPPPFVFDPVAITEIKQRLLVRLIMINLFILSGSALAGYFLAGRTLQPIADMVREQNRFITDASHELRTPLTALKSEIEVALRNKTLHLSDTKNILQSNLEEVNNLQSLSDNLITLSGDKHLRMEHVKLTGIVNEAIRRVSKSAKAKHMNITSGVSHLTVTGDPVLLTEVCILLLDNAIKYSADGKSIRVAAEKTDGKVAIHVIDQGYGIKQDDIPHVFDRFWRADTSRTKSTVRGYGLGLAIAKDIVIKHHGTIIVTSTLHKGSIFTVELPA